MLGLQEVTIKLLTDHPWLVSLAGLGLLVLMVFLYRRTNPPLPLRWRLLMAGLRTVAILALITILLEPVVTYLRHHLRQPRLAIVQDASASMNRVEGELSRQQRLDSLMQTPAWQAVAQQSTDEKWYYGASLVSSSDEVDPTASALGDVLFDLAKNALADPVDVYLLLSDGRSNAGRDPIEAAAALDAPVIAIDLSAESEGVDIGLIDIDFNPVVFAGQPTEIKLELAWQECADRRMRAELRQQGKVVAHGDITAGVESGRGEINLRFTPEQPGQQLMQVYLPALEGETNSENNSRSFSIKVLKSKMLVLLASPHPDHEVGFLKRFLEGSDKYEVEFVSTGEKSGNLRGQLPSQLAALNRYDLVILHDPDIRQLEARADIMRSYLAERGGALWVMMGATYASRPPADWLIELLPFYRSRPLSQMKSEFHAEPAEGYLLHPVLRLGDSQNSIRKIWSELPPFQALVPCDRTAPDATVLAWATGKNPNSVRVPVLGIRRHGPGKVLASAALPFWTWGFVNRGLGEEDRYHADFLEGTISWLTVSDDFEPLQVSPSNNVFTRGEPVVFDGHAFDQGFRPLPDVVGLVQLTSDNGGLALTSDMVPGVPGKLSVSFPNLPPGNYAWSASLSQDGSNLKESSGQLLIESFSLEEFDQRGDRATLSAIAQTTGGEYHGFSEFGQAMATLDLTGLESTISNEYSLWGRTWLLILFVLALGCEWILRKYHQLI